MKLSPEAALRTKFQNATGRIQLPAGVTELQTPLQLPQGAHDVVIAGDPAGSTLRMAANFRGSAAIVGSKVSNLHVSGFRIAGSRTALQSNWYLPAADQPFSAYYDSNGLLLTDSRGVEIRNLELEKIKAFPILITRCENVSIESVTIRDSGTLNSAGHSNTTGGILLEEGTADFSVKGCHIRNICGNGIWTHSNYHSPRNRDGTIEGNEIRSTPRDAIQIGHALRVRVLNNSGGDIGVPSSQVDTPAQATPVALDSSGDVAEAVYSGNHFTDVGGQCIDLDGFHDGEVTDNSCINKKPLNQYPFLHTAIVFGNSFPEMKPGGVTLRRNVVEGFGYGGLFLIGEKNRIEDNRFVNLNRNHCTGAAGNAPCNYALEEPGMLRSGIYLASHAARPAQTRRNVIQRNFISGFGAKQWCIAAAPAVSLAANEVKENQCVDLP